MAKMHLKITGVDAKGNGQSQYEYDHQAACGYVRNNVTFSGGLVTCFYCLKSEEMNLIYQEVEQAGKEYFEGQQAENNFHR